MTITAWRVVKQQFATAAFDGEGARIFGGRWHSAGRAAVYTSATTSLGLLEQLVHADMGLLRFYSSIPVNFDADLAQSIDPGKLPDNWRSHPAPFELQQLGNDWIDSMQSCILEVPSVIVPHESNYVLNPSHPDFASLGFGDPVGLEMDARLV